MICSPGYPKDGWPGLLPANGGRPEGARSGLASGSSGVTGGWGLGLVAPHSFITTVRPQPI